MKKNYEKPLAKKVTFNYQKVVASSSSCYWQHGTTHANQKCQDVMTHMNTVSLIEDVCGMVNQNG